MTALIAALRPVRLAQPRAAVGERVRHAMKNAEAIKHGRRCPEFDAPPSPHADAQTSILRLDVLRVSRELSLRCRARQGRSNNLHLHTLRFTSESTLIPIVRQYRPALESYLEDRLYLGPAAELLDPR